MFKLDSKRKNKILFKFWKNKKVYYIIKEKTGIYSLCYRATETVNKWNYRTIANKKNTRNNEVRLHHIQTVLEDRNFLKLLWKVYTHFYFNRTIACYGKSKGGCALNKIYNTYFKPKYPKLF